MQIKTSTFMKKFMFTAIAMVAFMGSSMANTIEIKEITVTIVDNKDICDRIALASAMAVIKEQGTINQAAAAAAAAYTTCIKLLPTETKPKK